MLQVDPIAWLRVVCGLFFLPHVAAKLIPPHTPLEFFRAAGFPAPRQVMYFAAAIELTVCIGLVFAILGRYAAWLGAAYLLVACGVLLKVGGRHKWQWIEGGIEYPAFWALVCSVIALGTPIAI